MAGSPPALAFEPSGAVEQRLRTAWLSLMPANGYVLAWAFLGLAAALAGQIWPFRTGFAGVFLNTGLGIAGGILGGYALAALGPSHTSGGAKSLMGAVMGALLLLLLAHALWAQLRPRRA